MSWQAYIDTSLVGSGHVDQAAIVSIAGDSIWASSAGFTPKLDELKVLSSILAGNQAARDKAFSDGVHIAGERYVLARVDDTEAYMRQGRKGIVIAKSVQAIIIAHHGETQIAGNTTSTTVTLSDYLKKLGY